MATTANGRADDERIERFEGGASWIAEPDEAMGRTSHVLAANNEVWVIDPVDMAGLDDLLGEFGAVTGVTVLLDRHERDAAAVARRHDVSVHLPHQLHAISEDFDAPVSTFETELGNTGYRPVPVITNRFWREVALYNETTGTLLVPEALGTVEAFRVGSERLGVHPALRFVPPRAALAGLDPQRVLVGHGWGVFENASRAFEDALSNSRSRAPRYYLTLARNAFD